MRKRIGKLTVLEKIKDRNDLDNETYIYTMTGNKTYKKYAEKIVKKDLNKLGFSNIIFKSVSGGIRGEYYILGNYKKDKIDIQKQVIDYDIIFKEYGTLKVIRYNDNPTPYNKENRENKIWEEMI